jgi:hypothetical protein
MRPVTIVMINEHVKERGKGAGCRELWCWSRALNLVSLNEWLFPTGLLNGQKGQDPCATSELSSLITAAQK